MVFHRADPRSFRDAGIPDRALFEIPKVQSDSVVATLGEDRAAQAVDRADTLFHHAFVDSGITHSTVTATRTGGVASFAIHVCAQLLASCLPRRLPRDGDETPAVRYDGAFSASVCRRNNAPQIKASTAGFASPLSFHIAGHSILLVMA